MRGARVRDGVDLRACIGCAACATVAPEHFRVERGRARVVRPATTEDALRRCDAARTLCPVSAILEVADSEAGDDLPEDAPVTASLRELYPELAAIAEGARWRVAELPWASFRPERATPALRAVVREMAFSEQTTFSATQRFMQAFSDDTDLTQWISVWFYEETRHPMVLLRWLALAGETTEPDFVLRGRVSAPFMRSRIGTLVTNVLSEIVAASAYLGLSRSAPEPLLATMAQRIASDEARHSASFFSYAQTAIARSEQPGRDILDALKVLHFWLNETANVTHPVNQAMEKFRAMGEETGLEVVFTAPVERMCRAVGLLTGLPIRTPDDVSAHLAEHTARLHRARG